MSNPNKKAIHDKPVIGITVGDLNGIGPEVIIKALSDLRILRYFTPVVYGSAKVFGFYRKTVKDNFVYHQMKDFAGMNPKKVNIYNIWSELVEIKPGEVNDDGGKYARISLEKATTDLIDGHIHGLVTAPINKENIQSEDFEFPGHTEYLASKTESNSYLMLMVSHDVRVAVATGHMPLNEVAGTLTKELLESKLKVLISSLKKDFGIAKPKVAVLGLNPHAGEQGLLGNEEKEIIGPVIEDFKNKGNLVFGPFPADGFFGAMAHQKYDAVLAMYHDQGLTPFKYMAFESGVNFTAGLPIVRTSPDHGTAYGIAGSDSASEESMRQALYLAREIIVTRKENNTVLA